MKTSRGYGYLLLASFAISGFGCNSLEVADDVSDGPPEELVRIEDLREIQPRIEPRSRCGNPPSYVVNGKLYNVLPASRGFVQRGVASWYGRKFHGKRTSNGEIYDMFAISAAHRTLPLPTYLRVTNIENNRRIVVRVNDRGPFHSDRIIDLSYAAAMKLGIHEAGTGEVEIRAVDSGEARDSSVPSTLSQLYLQIGAFKERDNAEKLSGELRNLSMSKARIRKDLNNKSSIYRVQLGPVHTQEQVNLLTEQLSERGFNEFRFVTEYLSQD